MSSVLAAPGLTQYNRSWSSCFTLDPTTQLKRSQEPGLKSEKPSLSRRPAVPMPSENYLAVSIARVQGSPIRAVNHGRTAKRMPTCASVKPHSLK